MKRIILFIILTTSAICYGLNEIRVYYPSNHSVFSVVRNQSGQIWNGSAFEDFNDIYDCNIPMTDKLGSLYLGNFPSCDANSYTIMSYFDLDSTPDNNDVLIQFEEGYWTGTLWRSSRDRLEDIKTETGTIADVNNNLETAISNITVDNGAIADEVVLHMDANSTQLAAIVEDTGTTLPNTLTALRSAIDANFAEVIEDTGTAIPNTLTTLRSAMDANFASIDFDTSGIDANFVTLRNAMDANFANINVDFPTKEEIRAEIDSNSTQLAAILEDTGTTLPNTLTALRSAIDANFAEVIEDTGTTIPNTLTALRSAMDANFANLVTPDAAGTAAGLIAGMNDISISDVETALDNYDTLKQSQADANFAAINFGTSGIDANFVTLRNAMDANFAAIPSQISDLKSQIDANFVTLRNAMDANFANTNNSINGLNDVSITDIMSSLEDYDVPTQAQMDANFSSIAVDVNSVDIAEAVWKVFIISQTDPETFGGWLQDAYDRIIEMLQAIPTKPSKPGIN